MAAISVQAIARRSAVRTTPSWQTRTSSVGPVSTSGFFFFQAEDGIRDYKVTGVQTCALPISPTFTFANLAIMLNLARRRLANVNVGGALGVREFNFGRISHWPAPGCCPESL